MKILFYLFVAMRDTAQIPMSRKAMRQAKKAEAKARAQAEKAAAEEAAEEAAVEAAVKAARKANLKTSAKAGSDIGMKKEENKHILTKILDGTIPAVTATVTLTGLEKASKKPVREAASIARLSKSARRKLKRRQRTENEVAPPKNCTEHVSEDEKSHGSAAKTSNTSTGSDFGEMLQNSQLDWIEQQAHRVYYEKSEDDKDAAFVYHNEMTPFQKLCSALESIDLNTLEKDDNPHPCSNLDWQFGWTWLPRLRNGSVFTARLCYRQLSDNAPAILCYQVQCRGISGIENGGFYTFLADGTPFRQYVDFCQYIGTQRPKFETARQEQRFEEQDRKHLVTARSLKIGSDGNPLSQSLSSLKEAGVVYRGKPRVVQKKSFVYCGNVDGEPVWAPSYTSTILAYKSYYRVVSNSRREQYQYGGEHFFYPSGRRCLSGVNFPYVPYIEEFRH